ncbi:ROK family transcriptional regulator [Albimonas pacifica]|uniref:Sugar kinase of the NBD/HSP70 family, may contain an N-terminal HTH domain n=1 Tax=Albimonas pacifica TaxID=1114924 RepID=A0A1I3I2Q1_9RHOB|nr:ROK family transcriptional regulator [Albimonas pacifica]SFI42117.1 Sugar kinase of the NBD/HSP70 family, may contain an N-terminal HTH domain [Albimonas pacifica]
MRGGDAGGLRAFNERRVIDAVLRAGALSKAEVARATGLSGQSASVIVERLVEQGLLAKGDKVRGRGQPSTPVSVAGSGAFSLGVKIGRRSVEARLIDLTGETVAERATRLEAPLPGPVMEAATGQARELLEAMSPAHRARLCGVGLALPGEMDAWADELGAPKAALAGWRAVDPGAMLAAATGAEVSVFNDAAAACAAEMLTGEALEAGCALYVHVGAFIGAGVVLDGRLYRGARLNAGALGSMPLAGRVPGAKGRQLIHAASGVGLARRLRAAGIDVTRAMAGLGGAEADAQFADWLAGAAPALARAVVSAMAVIDFEAVAIDGVLPPAWRLRLLDATHEAVLRFDRTGLSPAELREGTIGGEARVLGAALLPLQARFSPEPDLLINRRRARAAAGPTALDPAPGFEAPSPHLDRWRS